MKRILLLQQQGYKTLYSMLLITPKIITLIIFCSCFLINNINTQQTTTQIITEANLINKLDKYKTYQYNQFNYRRYTIITKQRINLQ